MSNPQEQKSKLWGEMTDAEKSAWLTATMNLLMDREIQKHE